jgi:predicted esterase
MFRSFLWLAQWILFVIQSLLLIYLFASIIIRPIINNMIYGKYNNAKYTISKQNPDESKRPVFPYKRPYMRYQYTEKDKKIAINIKYDPQYTSPKDDDLSKYMMYIPEASEHTQAITSAPKQAIICIHGLGGAPFIPDDIEQFKVMNCPMFAISLKCNEGDMRGWRFDVDEVLEGVKSDLLNIRKYMDANGIQKAVIVGHSIGGTILLDIMHQSSSLIRGNSIIRADDTIVAVFPCFGLPFNSGFGYYWQFISAIFDYTFSKYFMPMRLMNHSTNNPENFRVIMQFDDILKCIQYGENIYTNLKNKPSPNDKSPKVYIMASKKDKTVPYDRIVEIAKDPHQLISLDQVSHTGVRHDAYLKTLEQILDGQEIINL